MSADFMAYKLARAKRYLRRAKQTLRELNMVNEKVDSDFFAIESYCRNYELKLKGGNNEHRDNSNT